MAQSKMLQPTTQSAKLLRAILQELKLLRTEVSFLFPQDKLEDYAHPTRIKRSYEKALKQYPPKSSV
jgi:hypothetical protein